MGLDAIADAQALARFNMTQKQAQDILDNDPWGEQTDEQNDLDWAKYKQTVSDAYTHYKAIVGDRLPAPKTPLLAKLQVLLDANFSDPKCLNMFPIAGRDDDENM